MTWLKRFGKGKIWLLGSKIHSLAQCKHYFLKDFIFTIREFFLESLNEAISDLKIFNKCNSFLTPWYTHVRFLENFACFVFLLPSFWDSLFCLITDELIYHFCNLVSSYYFKYSLTWFRNHCQREFEQMINSWISLLKSLENLRFSGGFRGE